MSRLLHDNLKNIAGWRTDRRYVLFAVDDYGSVRTASLPARTALADAGATSSGNRFDHLDALETREDLEALFEVLTSVKDTEGRHAVFTPYALPCNIDFDAVASNGFERYEHEPLTETFAKLSAAQPEAYEGAWALWREGMSAGLLRPQFHGREHLSIKVFEDKLSRRDGDIMEALRHRSYAFIRQEDPGPPSWSAAFSFGETEELARFPEILASGLDVFKTVFGDPATAFTPPAQQFHPDLHPFLAARGVKAIDRPLYCRQHLGGGRYRRTLTTMRPARHHAHGLATLVRNVVFEPGEEGGGKGVDAAMRQIEAAFRWRKPALISSHRINFSGHIDPSNRRSGLTELRSLLRRIVGRWPDVRFMSVADLIHDMDRTS